MIITWMNGKIFLAFLLFISVFIANLFSQSLNFNNLSVKNGLSNNKVVAILQDKSGFLWFATEDGLNRFDGYEFKIYRNNPHDTNSISSNNIWSLFEDTAGNIWIGTKSGELNRYDVKKDIFERWKIESPHTQDNSINEIYRDKNGFLWIGTYQSGLYRLDIKTGKIKNWKYNPGDPNSLSNNFITSIVEDATGNFWISTYNGLNKFNPGFEDDSFQQFYAEPVKENSLTNNLIWSITRSESNSNLMWIGTADGLVSLNIKDNTFKRISIPKEPTLQFGNSVASVIEETINNDLVLWIGTYGGLVRLNLSDNEVTRFTKKEKEPSSIISNEINKLKKDRSGVIWAATENGISYITPKAMKFNNIFMGKKGFQELVGLMKSNIKSFANKNDGTIFFGTSDGVYNFKNSDGQTGFHKYAGTDKINVWSLAVGKSDDIWIGTYGQGLKRLNLKNGNVEHRKIESPTFKTSAFDFLKSLFLDDDNFLWIGFWGGGLARYNTQTGDYKIWIHSSDNQKSISQNDVWVIHHDRKGRLWLGTNGGGLNLFENKDGGKFLRWAENVNQLKKLSSSSIYSICESKPGKYSDDFNQTILWVGTSNGLNKITLNNSINDLSLNAIVSEVLFYNSQNGLADNSVKSILEDENGNLWLGTNSGISFFNVEKNSFINFSASDGLNGNEFNTSSALRSDDGLMYFGSVEGLNVFNPEEIIQSNYLPPVVFTDFQILNQPANIGEAFLLIGSIQTVKEIILSYEDNVFSFEFSALDFNDPTSIQYAYMMEGFDDDWIYSGSRRFITYTNLNSGNYTFKVKATNSDGVWNENYKSVSVIVNPPWWRTPWAYAGYIILIISGLFIARKIEINRARLRNELKMREFEAKKQRELEIIKSRFFANLSHEFRTPLTLIRGPVEELINGNADENKEEYYELIKRNSEKLQELIDQLLELTQLENAAIPLKAKKENIVQVLRGLFYSFESLAKQKNIVINFSSTDDSINCWFDRDKLEKIVNNLLSNAFKFTSTGGTISLSIIHQDNSGKDFVVVKISDTGIGIPKDKLGNIFNRFYQVDDSSRKKFGGSGIGLALVKELVDLHKWEIDVQSEIEKGTEFFLKIPFWDSYLNDNQKIFEAAGESPSPEKSETVSVEQTDDTEKEIELEIIENKKLLGEKQSLLVVEDSEDVRIYLKSLLKNEYSIHEAINGEDGLKKASEVMPDLIISDVMMPSMNGMEFCKKIKTDWQTSHIPVILLTAKASRESKLEGLETGADDYLTKPFSFKELSVRIKNLLEQRKALREKFSREIKIEPASIAVNSLDNEFLKKAFDVVEQNLSNTEFNSETFAKEMFLSRSQLHRKILALTGQAPGEFVRSFRLKKAASLILEKRLSITQIAFEVGFNSPSHFTKAFRQQFNCLPTEFTEKNNS
jgi:signal transduction histidine kinase/ligand-binding sensor domain-containing protein/DNA-binding response OmpR family regulator